RGGQDRVGSGLDGRGEVPDLAGAAAGDQRDVDDRAGGPDQLQVEPGLGAVRVHRVEQDLAGAELGGAPHPLHRVDAGPAAAAVRGDLETAGGGRAVGDPPDVGGEHQH